MGKDLHYSIKPFIESALSKHSAVRKFEELKNQDFYVYRLERIGDLGDVIVVLSDAYNFSYHNFYSKPDVLNEGGIILIAKPEASGIEQNDEENKISICRLSKLMGALHRKDFWTYTPPKKDNE